MPYGIHTVDFLIWKSANPGECHTRIHTVDLVNPGSDNYPIFVLLDYKTGYKFGILETHLKSKSIYMKINKIFRQF